MLITFDFDGTLTQAFYRLEAMKMRSLGHEVRVVTQRPESSMYDVIRVVDPLKIRDVHFTNGADKWETLDAIGSDIHFDDDDRQVDMINKRCKKTKAIKVNRR